VTLLPFENRETLENREKMCQVRVLFQLRIRAIEPSRTNKIKNKEGKDILPSVKNEKENNKNVEKFTEDKLKIIKLN